MLDKPKVMAVSLIRICAMETAAWAAAPSNLKSNRVKISYVPPSNPAHQHIYEVLRNAPDVTTAAGVTPQDAIVGPTIEVFFHEIGHAIFDLLKVPILGREEDAADQVASYGMLRLDKDIVHQTVAGVAYMYGHEMKSDTPGIEQFADAHGVSAQRFYNLLCMAYGKDSKLFADLVEKKYLPESRAEGCADEYKQVDYAFKKLIYPYIDQAQVKKVQPKKLLRPAQN